ncbi:transcription factor bHLH35-like [Musa acuminata AAA Group]|uniref:transcription factor bHLH35-like n=1 Tax=Musa acuminata AAA Group TaxID=214697 RepID=UPI0031D0B1EB
MNDMETEYNLYGKIKGFIDANELESWGLEEVMSGGYCESSFPEAATSLAATRNISMERSRRRKLNEKLYALRSVVPNITKLDKASIIKDAIEYIQQLQEQERTVLAELSQLESLREKKASLGELEFDDLHFLQRKKKRIALGSPISSSIEVVELRVREMDEKTMMVSITCTKKRHTMIKVCELFESLDLKFITANITSVSGSILHTLLVETQEMNGAQLKEKITTAISELHGSRNPISSIE